LLLEEYTKNINLMIKIIDNFFTDEDLKKVQDFALNKAYYTPRFLENTEEKTHDNFYGLRFTLNNDKKLLDFFIKQAEINFKIKILKVFEDSGIDQRSLDHFAPHTDHLRCKINILIMIYGPTAVTNGTVFYHGDTSNYELDTHVGFRPNRAIMFPSDKIHSPHAINDQKILRYTCSLFIEDYKEL